MSAQRGDELVELLLSSGSDDPEVNGMAAYDLLQEVFGGYPAEKLAVLIHSDRNSAVDAGAWIVSELGAGATPMMDEISFLLGHPSRRARFDAVDAVHSSATTEHGATIAKAVALIADPETAVRWRVLHFLTWATREQLEAGVLHLPGGRVQELTAWLARVGDNREEADEVMARLDGPDGLSRMFAVAAAGRLGERDRRPLERAALSADEQVSSFATKELRSARRRPR